MALLPVLARRVPSSTAPTQCEQGPRSNTWTALSHTEAFLQERSRGVSPETLLQVRSQDSMVLLYMLQCLSCLRGVVVGVRVGSCCCQHTIPSKRRSGTARDSQRSLNTSVSTARMSPLLLLSDLLGGPGAAYAKSSSNPADVLHP